MSSPITMEEAELLLPPIAARGLPLAIFRAAVEDLIALDGVAQSVRAALIAAAEASGPLLDVLGAQVGEPRDGLTDPEYRRVIVARRVAQADAVSTAAVWGAWLAGCGIEASDGRILEGEASMSLAAATPYVVSTAFAKRIGRVMRDTIAAGMQFDATIGGPGTMFWGDPNTPWGYAWGVDASGGAE